MAAEASSNNGYLVGSNLERVLRAGHFAVTAELGLAVGVVAFLAEVDPGREDPLRHGP